MGKRARSGQPSGDVVTAHAQQQRRGLPKMAAHLLALTADGGVPLLTRKVGDLKTLPFALVGTLNGVHLFSRLRGAALRSVRTAHACTVWRTYHESVVLIVVTNEDGTDEGHLAHLLDNVFAVLVMTAGLDALTNIRNVDRLKRELKACYSLLDHLLHQLDQNLFTMGDLTSCVDCFFCPEASTLQGYLDGFVELADSDYGCLLVRGKVAVATKKWWSLSGQEMALLSCLVNSAPKTTMRDVSVYLPTSCPSSSNRFLVFHLMQGIDLCVFCGPNPTLEELEEEVPRYWKGAFELLKSASSLHPRNIPSGFSLDKNILAFLLVHKGHGRSLCSVQPEGVTTTTTTTEEPVTRLKEGHSSRCFSLRRRQEILRVLYKTVFRAHLQPQEGADTTCPRQEAQEIYSCSEGYKSYVVNQNPHQLLLLFSPAVPTYAMRSIAHKTLKTLTSQKSYQL